MPGARRRRGDLGNPEIGRTAQTLVGFGGNAAIGCDQREFAIQRLFGGDEHAQRRAFPRGKRRREHRDVGGVAARCRGRGACIGLGENEN